MTSTRSDIQSIIDAFDALALSICDSGAVLPNQRVRQWLDLPDAPTIRDLWSYVHPEVRREAFRIYRQMHAGVADDIKANLRIRHQDDRVQWVKATIKRIAPDCWLVTLVELTVAASAGEQRMPEITVRTSIETNPVLQEMANQPYLVNEALDRFLRNLEKFVPYTSASITLLNNGHLDFIAAHGLPSDIDLNQMSIDIVHAMPKRIDETYSAADNEAFVIHDVHQNPDWVVYPGTEHIRSWMGVLMRYQGEMIGLLNLDHIEPNFFTYEMGERALLFVEQASLAIICMQLYRQSQLDLQERARLQEIMVKNLINTETMYATQQLLFNVESLDVTLPDLLNFLSAAIDQTDLMLVIFNLADGELLHSIKNSGSDLNIAAVFNEVTGQTPDDQLTMPAQDLEWKSHQSTRLTDGRQVLGGVVNRRGLLLAIRPADAPPFEDGDYELIYTAANQIKITLENKMLDAQLRQHTQHLERLVERRTAQLSVERKRLRAILDSTAEGIFYMENFLIQYANPAFCRMVGYSLDDLYGKPLSHIRIVNEGREKFNFNTLLTSADEVEPGRGETRLRHRDGTEFYASIRFSLVGKPGENPVRMVAIARDISMERKLYFQRARFISNAAHELRTPLSSLILRLHMLRRQPERVEDHLTNLDKVTGYLRELVEELLDLSRFERGTIMLERNTHELQTLIRQAVDNHTLYADEAQVTLDLQMPDEPIMTRVDGTRIVQMVSNMVVNGINYNKPEGMVLVRVQIEKDPIGNRNAIIEVIDNGLGIEPELLPDDIFEPFSRPSQGSRRETGMGLALAREIATLHGGTIHARSQFGEGSTLRVNLPLD